MSQPGKMKASRKIVKFLALAAFSVPTLPANAQKIFEKSKPALDTAILKKWPAWTTVFLTDNGKYLMTYFSDPLHHVYTTEIRSQDGKWHQVLNFRNYVSAALSDRLVIYKTPGDTLVISKLGESKREEITNIKDWQLPTGGNKQNLAYRTKTNSKNLWLRDLATGREREFPNVEKCLFDQSGTVLLLAERDADNQLSVKWIELSTGKEKICWQGADCDNFIFDASGSQVAFTTRKDKEHSMIWLYHHGVDRSAKAIVANSDGVDDGYTVDGITRFSPDGSRLFLTLKKLMEPTRQATFYTDVNVWNYRDAKLQSEQLQDVKRGDVRSYAAVFNLKDSSGKIIQLERKNEHVDISPTSTVPLLLLSKAREQDALSDPPTTWSLISPDDGHQIDLPNRFLFPKLSWDGKFVVDYNRSMRTWFSYEVSSHRFHTIATGVRTDWRRYDAEDDYTVLKDNPRGIAAWHNDPTKVLLYDRTDIWLADLYGKSLPVNFTNGYGRKHNVVLSLAFYSANQRNEPVDSQKRLLLTAFNTRNKQNGFFTMPASEPATPICLTMDDHVYDYNDVPIRKSAYQTSLEPVKAKSADIYIVQKQSASEAPNYYFTSDFKTFKQITDIHPERNYNWMTTELITWKMTDGRTSQGVLYKPENFDPHKKYPVIFYYYQQMSNGLNAYQKVETSDGSLNTAWYVSNGYLVFMPDIHYHTGEPGPGYSALNSIVSAANYLAQKPYVDAKKMGLQGISFGGYETNFIVSHSKLFAAACSASGASDLISRYGQLRLITKDNPLGEISSHHFTEQEQFRLGWNLWQKPELYIKNSPIFLVNKITSPLLLLGTTYDGAVAFQQAIEFFTALRHLNKPAWMLQYENGSHSVWGEDAKDFNIRMRQFFDHYLKGQPPPVWMTRGIPAALKGITSGYELDPEGSCSKDCPVCKKKDYQNIDLSNAVIKEFVKVGQNSITH